MFTSRAEYRLTLREDNADLRLTAKGHEFGLVDDRRWKAFSKKSKAIAKEQQRLKSTWIKPNTKTGKAVEKILEQPLAREYSLQDLLKRPNITYQKLMAIKEINAGITNQKIAEQLEIQAKYAGYIERQKMEIERHARYENTSIPENFDYKKAINLSSEVLQKLTIIKPTTIGMASRIPGVTPAAISLLLVYLKRQGND
jgi:tRNA uridine 5-carboxymethylaminomethyl modification enzyme